MAGFFKKLFNRVGSTAAPAPPAEIPERDPDAPAEWILRELLANQDVVQAEPVAAEAAPPSVIPPIAAEPVAPDVVQPGLPPPVIEPVIPATAHTEAQERKIEAKAKTAKRSSRTNAPSAKLEIKKPEAKAPAKAGSKPVSARAKPKAPPAPEAEPAPLPIARTPEIAVPPPQSRPVPQELPSEPAPPEIPPSPEPAPGLPPEPQPLPPQPEPVQIPPPASKAGALLKPAAPQVALPPPEPERKGWLGRLRHGLSKSSRNITSSITSIFTKKKLDAGTLQELEDVLLQADLGLPMAERIIKAVATGRFDKEIDPDEVKRILAEEVTKVLKPVEVPFNFGSEKPFVILVVGVNGSGKTTTIGKLGAIAAREGFKVMFAACDTFRAAAIEQLTVWGKRVGARTISRPTGADSSGLAFDAMKEARDDGADILFIDTAGRLQNKAYLMDELDKVVRVIKKQEAAAPHAVLLVLDATTGQNAVAQAEVFTKVAGVTGLIMTKLDGTARGGILVAIAEKFKLPVHAIGVGEQIDDLQPFDAEAFARAIAGLDEK